ncbi:hypothetical protein ACQ5JZ_01690 [Streptomyces sp. ZG43]|uniref:hypothetical protein n=1 Tax=Streptomyces TaxID=1883 RepID=UPI000D14552C|nr:MULTISPECIES: hypothetical protein [unclassified Streptomyces]WSB24274.1 hypothetical protein OHB02_14205 [Streptomyces albidoflavus]
MNLTDLHGRLPADVLAVGGAYPLALTGGYAVQAHGLVDRLSQDLDVATGNPDRMEDLATAVRWPGAAREAGQRSGNRPPFRVQAAANRWSHVELEELGRRHARDSFDLSELQARLDGADWIGDTKFAACGLDEQAIIGLRQWAQAWVTDIGERLQELETPHED